MFFATIRSIKIEIFDEWAKDESACTTVRTSREFQYGCYNFISDSLVYVYSFYLIYQHDFQKVAPRSADIFWLPQLDSVSNCKIDREEKKNAAKPLLYR